MKYQIDFRNVDDRERDTLRAMIDERVGQLEEKLGSLAEQGPRLRGALQKHGKHSLYRLGLSIHLPGRTIGVEEEAERAESAISAAFAELQRQVQRYKSRLRNEHLWKRKRRRKELQARKGAATAEAEAGESATHTQSGDWFREIEPYLDALYDFARHEITHLQQNGELSPDDIQPDELVDSVVVAAWERRAEKSDTVDTETWLYRIAIELLDREVQRHARRQSDISTETVVSRGYDPDDDSIYEFYQPDEVLRVEDLIATTDQAPEAERRLPAVFGQLPRSWRRGLLLRDVSGLSLDQVAAALDMQRERLERNLEQAQDFLSARLAEMEQVAAQGLEGLDTLLKKLTRRGYPQKLRDELKKKFGA